VRQVASAPTVSSTEMAKAKDDNEKQLLIAQAEFLSKSEQDGYDIQYKQELDNHTERVNNYNTNKKKAFKMIQDHCNTTMKTRLEQQEDYETKLKNDPIATLERIKQLMHDPIRARYPFASLTRALEGVINIQMNEGERLTDYTDRFKQARDILKSMVGTELFDQFIEHTEEYRTESDTDKQKEMKKTAWEKWITYNYVRKTDYRFKSLIDQWTTNHSLNHTGELAFPKTMERAILVLGEHKWDPKPAKKASNYQNNGNTGNTDTSQASTQGNSFAQRQQKDDDFCYCCGAHDHYSTACPHKDKPRNQWYVWTARQHYQQNARESTREHRSSRRNDDDDNGSQASYY